MTRLKTIAASQLFVRATPKLYNAWSIGNLSIKNERANSAYMKEPKTYNTIDADHKIKDEGNPPLTNGVLGENIIILLLICYWRI